MATTVRDSSVGPEFFGGLLKLRKLEEVVTIAVGSGSGGVATTTNMFPAGLVLSVGFVVEQAPGGGATLLNIGVTGEGNADRFIDDNSCDVLGENGVSPQNGDGVVVYPEFNKTATTLDLTTDADVTGLAMKVRVITTYLEMVAPQ